MIVTKLLLSRPDATVSMPLSTVLLTRSHVSAVPSVDVLSSSLKSHSLGHPDLVSTFRAAGGGWMVFVVGLSSAARASSTGFHHDAFPGEASRDHKRVLCPLNAVS